MATRRQKKANRKNAKRSTGPRTPEGKARSSQNASRHGLFARDTLLPDENPEEFIQLIDELELDLKAVGGFERRLVCHIADAEWRMRRLVRLETGALTHQLETERLRAQQAQAALGIPPPVLEPNRRGQNPRSASSHQNQDAQANHTELSQPEPSEENQNPRSGPEGLNQSTLEEPEGQNHKSPAVAVVRGVQSGAYQQTTRELGSAVLAYTTGPLLLTLSLYESRLNRKHQSLLKQLRLTQKLRLAEGAERVGQNHLYRNSGKAPSPRHETVGPRNDSAEPQALPGETQDHPSRVETESQQSKVETEIRPAAAQPQPPLSDPKAPPNPTRAGPQDDIPRVA